MPASLPKWVAAPLLGSIPAFGTILNIIGSICYEAKPPQKTVTRLSPDCHQTTHYMGQERKEIVLKMIDNCVLMVERYGIRRDFSEGSGCFPKESVARAVDPSAIADVNLHLLMPSTSNALQSLNPLVPISQQPLLTAFRPGSRGPIPGKLIPKCIDPYPWQ